jgi:hypothetical protein
MWECGTAQVLASRITFVFAIQKTTDNLGTDRDPRTAAE